ncbi:MAG: TGS domain-containing protein, partial [Pseudomonadota bacterium]|nr:TGS domain-containing protein [Pseudomonadota bacterium]
MPVITLPDGSSRQFDNAITVYDVAADIGAGLAKATLAGVVDGREVDASYSIVSDAELRIITSRDDQALEILRHSTAHLLAQAVQQLFPGTQVTIGPTVEDGFYYDFASDHYFSLEDLEKIEAKMQELVADDLTVSRLVYSREQAIEMFRDMGEHYKVEIIEELPEGEEISVYQQGDWMDLCRGPHVPSTGKLGAFKLTKVAGA